LWLSNIDLESLVSVELIIKYTYFGFKMKIRIMIIGGERMNVRKNGGQI
jgi:hypothetical protein